MDVNRHFPRPAETDSYVIIWPERPHGVKDEVKKHEGPSRAPKPFSWSPLCREPLEIYMIVDDVKLIFLGRCADMRMCRCAWS